MTKASASVAAVIRDDLITQVNSLVIDDPDPDRAWTMEQVLSSYKRSRRRLLEYVEARKGKE